MTDFPGQLIFRRERDRQRDRDRSIHIHIHRHSLTELERHDWNATAIDTQISSESLASDVRETCTGRVDARTDVARLLLSSHSDRLLRLFDDRLKGVSWGTYVPTLSLDQGRERGTLGYVVSHSPPHQMYQFVRRNSREPQTTCAMSGRVATKTFWSRGHFDAIRTSSTTFGYAQCVSHALRLSLARLRTYERENDSDKGGVVSLRWYRISFDLHTNIK